MSPGNKREVRGAIVALECHDWLDPEEGVRVTIQADVDGAHQCSGWASGPTARLLRPPPGVSWLWWTGWYATICVHGAGGGWYPEDRVVSIERFPAA